MTREELKIELERVRGLLQRLTEIAKANIHHTHNCYVYKDVFGKCHPDCPHVALTLASSGAESADIGKLDTADKSGAALSAAEEINKVNRARGHVLKSDHYGETADVMPTEEMARIIQRHWAGSAETGGEKAAPQREHDGGIVTTRCSRFGRATTND